MRIAQQDCIVTSPQPEEHRMALKGLARALTIAITGTALVACGPQDPIDSTDLQLSRMAIYEGLDVGTPAMVGSVNQVLRQNTISYTFDNGIAVSEPLPGDPTCPFVNPNPILASANCDLMVAEAVSLAQRRAAQSLDTIVLGPEFDGAEDPDRIRHWFEAAAIFAPDNLRASAVFALRDAGICDAEPTRVRNAEIEGYEQGRFLFAQRLEEQVARTPETECDFDAAIVNPTIDISIGLIPSIVNDAPLCPGFTPSNGVEQAELSQSMLTYEQGIRQGIVDQAAIASRDLLETWVCVPPQAPEQGGQGDPIVIDLKGDGIAAPMLARVDFDLTGIGAPAQMAWPTADDALLAIDLNHNGTIDGGRELFSNYTTGPSGTAYTSGFEALASYDHPALGGNADGAITKADAVYEKLVVWSDTNRDGISDASEMISLSQAKLTSLSLDVERIRIKNGDATMTERAGLLTEMWFKLQY